MPDEWAHQVRIWNRILRARLGDVEGTAPPDRNDEYLFYQLLLGAWPAELTGVTEPNPEGVRAFCERLEGAMVKSMREAKLHSTWASPDTAYEEAMLGFIRVALDMSRQNAFLEAFLPFQERVARLGMRNSLVQTTLKLTLPGMPDIYQGAELWDLSLVDPDNRRPVDYARHARMLTETLEDLSQDSVGAWSKMSRNWHDGRAKLAVTAILLAQRRETPDLFAHGDYEPLLVNGDKADHICAFSRTGGHDTLVTIAARFPLRLEANPGWADTNAVLPHTPAATTRWRDLLTGRLVDARGADALPIEVLLPDLPVAVLIPDRLA